VEKIEREARSYLPPGLTMMLLMAMLSLFASNGGIVGADCWMLCLFEGLGSFAHACDRAPHEAVWHVVVATGLKTSVDRVRKRVQLGLKLGENFDVGVIVRQVWQVSGLPASMLVGISSSNPCTTVCKFEVINRSHRSPQCDGWAAESSLAKLDDKRFLVTIRQLFACMFQTRQKKSNKKAKAF
jgi:hypothetical protein